MHNFWRTCSSIAGAAARPGSVSYTIFDRTAKQLQKNRAALLPDSTVADYLREEVAYQIADRVADIKRKFSVAVDFGCGRGHLAKFLTSESVSFLYQCDSARHVLRQTQLCSSDVPTCNVLFDGEFFPFKESSLDLVLSSLSLHWVNDLPGAFKQILRSLRNDGCFLGVLFAGDTLFELRVALQLAEMERLGGFSPHISPFTENVDIADLLARAGFTLLTVDVEDLVINYPSMFHVVEDLRLMGETNCAFNRPLRINKDVMMAAAGIYQDKFGKPRPGVPDETCVPATFRLVYFIGWKPDPSQPKPLPRGSAQFSLKDMNRIDEIAQQQTNTSEPTKKS